MHAGSPRAVADDPKPVSKRSWVRATGLFAVAVAVLAVARLAFGVDDFLRRPEARDWVVIELMIWVLAAAVIVPLMLVAIPVGRSLRTWRILRPLVETAPERCFQVVVTKSMKKSWALTGRLLYVLEIEHSGMVLWAPDHASAEPQEALRVPWTDVNHVRTVHSRVDMNTRNALQLIIRGDSVLEMFPARSGFWWFAEELMPPIEATAREFWSRAGAAAS